MWVDLRFFFLWWWWSLLLLLLLSLVRRSTLEIYEFYLSKHNKFVLALNDEVVVDIFFVASCWNWFYFLFISSYLKICYAKCLFRIRNHRHARTHSTQPQLIHTCKIKHERLKSARTRWILRITLKAQSLVNKYVSELSGDSINSIFLRLISKKNNIERKKTMKIDAYEKIW